MRSVKFDGQSYAVLDFVVGDYPNKLTILNYDKLKNKQYPAKPNISLFESTMKVLNISESEDFYNIKLAHGIDYLGQTLTIKLHREPVGYILNPNTETKSKKSVYSFITENFNLIRVNFTSDDCETPEKFLEFVYISLKDNLTNDNPF